MIEIGTALDPGRRRIAQANQDALRVVRPRLLALGLHPAGLWSRPPLLVVADGMGGYEGGAVASQTVVESFARAYQEAPPGAQSFDILRAGVDSALRTMREQADADPNLEHMGSTVVAAILKGSRIYLLNIGDSRAYIVGTKGVRQISHDHSLAGEQLRRGLISESEIRSHPRRNVLSMSLSAQHGEIDPFTGIFPWHPGERLVLCSDGLWGPVTEAQLQAVVLEYPAQEAAQKLVGLANANHGPDNIAVIVARLG